MKFEKTPPIVANWILLGIFMLIIQVLLGGITRLTGSGLSITEWKPIMGALPPMNEGQWQAAFEKYQNIAQYKYLNTHFTLSDFKFIFFWEWLHRNWARLIGVVFAIPFIYFLIKGYFKKWMINPLLILFLLGALQGAVGWIMVQSGLNQEDLYVSHIRLATHFIAAMGLIGYALVFWLMLKTRPHQKILDRGLKNFTLIIISVLTMQLIYGAFMAGLKAATAAPTFPDINGMYWIDLSRKHITNHTIAVQFFHRMLAYTLFVLIVWWWFKAKNHLASKPFTLLRNLAVLLMIIQITLGALAVINSPKIIAGHFGMFEWFALLHQLVGMLLLLSFIGAFYLLRRTTIKSS